MSTTIEQRVVEMKFDNKNFEKNVSTTMSTLDKLKQKLNLTGASKGLENIDTKAKSVNFSGLSNSVDTVRSKFSALEVIGITALANITNSAVNAGKRIASALTIDPIKTGFQEYETQINAVQTILANTQHKGTNLDDVNKALDELNTYADKTIYNFTEMTRNIGTFTAAGVDLDTSVSAIQGIANLAAVSGSTSQQASTAMYQLSQALANGKVNLMDWNSVVNAGMGGQVFQDALKRTAKSMGTDVDALIKKYGSFRESLTQGEWLTSEVLTKTLQQFTMSAEEGSEAWEKYKKSLMSEGYTEAQAIEILKMANTATDAATKVKTFTQLWDTLKESAQSGWTQTWEILVGDFEEAKSLLTGISNVVGNFINKTSEARNTLLQGWKDAGGRTATLDALKNVFTGIYNIIKPIKEAFREIFPPLTVEQLLSFSDKFKELTGRFAEFTERHSPKIKSTFKGIFAVLDIVATVIGKVVGGIFKITGSILGFTGGILSGTASLGDWLSNIRDSIKESNIFGKAIDGVVRFIQNGIDKIQLFGEKLKRSFELSGYSGFFGFLKATWEFITKIGSGISKTFGGLGKAIANVFGENSFGDVIDSGLFAGLLVGLFKFVKKLDKPLTSLSEMFDSFKEGTSNIVGILDDVRGCFQAYQEQLKAGSLLKIAGAIGILAASIFVISTINPESLGQSLGAITVLFAELAGTMYALSKIEPGIKSTIAMVPLMLSLSTSMLLLATALKIIGSMEPSRMVSSLIGLAGGMLILVKTIDNLPENDVRKAAKAIRKLSSSLLVFSLALKIMGTMEWHEMAVALGGVVVGLAAMVIAVNKLPEKKTVGLLGMATSLVVLGAALKIIGSMNWKELALGLGAVIISLTAMVVAVNKLPDKKAAGLLGMATSLVILGGALKVISSMNWKELALGLGTIIVSLIAITTAVKAMPEKGMIGKSAAMIGIATSLVILGGALKILGSMSWKTILKSLVSLAGAFTVIGVAGYLLSPIVPAILGLAGASALFGVSALALGAGLGLIATGITLLAASIAGGATAIVAGITVIIVGILDLIPTITLKLVEAIMAFCQVIGDCAPAIADALLQLISETLIALAKYTPVIANSLFDLLIGVLDVLSARMPELIVAAVKVINSFFVGVANAMQNLDGANLLKGVIAVGIMSALVYVLAGVSGMIGPAMLGLLGVGALIAELTLILAAIGALSQIPGLSWLIEEGGDLLQKVGTAIGQFVGGIIGGLAQGITSALPKIASDLSDFIINIQPFIQGAKQIDTSLLEGVAALAGAILILTGADIISSLTSFFTGKNSLSDFGNQLVPFGKSLKAYGKAVSGVDATSISKSATATKALVKVAKSIPNEGGLFSIFTGDNDLSSFAEHLIPFGKSLKAYGKAVVGIDTKAITGSASAAKALAKLADVVPNEGGMVAWFTGENSLSKFSGELEALGVGLKKFAVATTGIAPDGIIACAGAAKALAEMMNVIPNEGGIIAWLTGENSVSRFGNDLLSLGMGLKNFAIATTGIVPESIIASATAAKALAQMMDIIPNEGGMVAWFTGENSVSRFGNDLLSLGMGLKNFAIATTGIVPESIVSAANAAKALAQMTNSIPNEGGVVAWFTGENSISSFASKLPLLGSGLNGFATATNGIKPESVIAASNAAKNLAEMTNSIPNEGGIKAWFTGETSISNFSDKLPKLGKGLAGFSTAVEGINAENVTAAAAAAKALAEMTNFIPEEGGMKAWFTGETSISNFADKLPSLGKGIKGFSKSVEGINPENVKAAASAAKNLAQMAETAPKDSDKIIKFGENLGKFGDKLKSYFSKMSGVSAETIKISSDAITSIVEATDKLNGFSLTNASVGLEALLKAVKKTSVISESTVQGFVNAMKKLGETNIQAVIDAFVNAGPKLESAGSKSIQSLILGISSQYSNTKKACDNIANVLSDCISEIRNTYSSFYNAGLYVVTGFASGISANTYKATAKAKAMAAAARNAAEKELGINSPSKVFYKIGAFTGEGFVNALIDSTRDVFNASSLMAEYAKNGISDTVDMVTDLLDSDMNTNPTIRPVLDLSDIQSGMNGMNSMFGDVGINANLRAISSGVNSRLQNGINGEVVSAIDKLRKDLGNVGGTTNNYNVNGVTYDDGSNITEAVRTIVRAATMGRRV